MTFEIMDVETGTYKDWNFTVNNEKYIDLSIAGTYMDTLFDLGKTFTIESLKEKTEKLISSWNVTVR